MNAVRAALPALVALAGLALPAKAEERRNWFDDPFFQASEAVANCPEPRGPRITESERAVQAHHRAERGTTCWLRGECDQANAYAYDPAIAQRIRARWGEDPARADTTLWVTVQGRVVYLEGCLRDARQAVALEAFARSIAEVQQAVVIARTPDTTGVLYPVWIERHGPPSR